MHIAACISQRAYRSASIGLYGVRNSGGRLQRTAAQELSQSRRAASGETVGRKVEQRDTPPLRARCGGSASGAGVLTEGGQVAAERVRDRTRAVVSYLVVRQPERRQATAAVVAPQRQAECARALGIDARAAQVELCAVWWDHPAEAPAAAPG